MPDIIIHLIKDVAPSGIILVLVLLIYKSHIRRMEKMEENCESLQEANKELLEAINACKLHSSQTYKTKGSCDSDKGELRELIHANHRMS